MRPTLAIDIDEVLSETNQYILELLAVEHGIFLEYHNLNHHWFPNISGFPFDGPTTIQLFREFLSRPASLDISPVSRAFDGLQQLQLAGIRLIALTARHQSIESSTKSWLSKNFPNIFEDVYFL